jgi:predicted RNase H-like nuclease (RuvC/YqgF family)
MDLIEQNRILDMLKSKLNQAERALNSAKDEQRQNELRQVCRDLEQAIKEKAGVVKALETM